MWAVLSKCADISLEYAEPVPVMTGLTTYETSWSLLEDHSDTTAAGCCPVRDESTEKVFSAVDN